MIRELDFSARTLKITKKGINEDFCYATTRDKIFFNNKRDSNDGMIGKITPDNIVIGKPMQHIDDKNDEFLKELLKSIASNSGVFIYPPYEIKSLYSGLLVLTLIKDNQLSELVCKCVKLNSRWLENYNSILEEPAGIALTAEVDLYHQILGFDINSIACDRFKFNAGIERIDSLVIPLNILHSIECYSSKQYVDVNMPDDAKWMDVNKIKINDIKLRIDYESKIIFGEYYKTGKAGCGRRTSNGWESCIFHKVVKFHRSFELMFEIDKFLESLPRQLQSVEGNLEEVEKSTVSRDGDFEKYIRLSFAKPIGLGYLIRLIDFYGTSYEYYTYL